MKITPWKAVYGSPTAGCGPGSRGISHMGTCQAPLPHQSLGSWVCRCASSSLKTPTEHTVLPRTAAGHMLKATVVTGNTLPVLEASCC